MELTKVNDLARGFFQTQNCENLNLLFHGSPWPLGFAHRNWIGLSADFCLMNGAGPIGICILHEIGHWFHGPGHDGDFKTRMDLMGVTPVNLNSLNSKFLKLYDGCLAIRGFKEKIELWLIAIFRNLDRRVEKGIERETDYKSFIKPLMIDGDFPIEMDDERGEILRRVYRDVRGY
jgi:hypothetical protein